MSPQDDAKLEQSQQKFLNDTSDLRTSIQEKQFALNQELQQANPDQTMVTNLQKELSQLESQFDQKALISLSCEKTSWKTLSAWVTAGGDTAGNLTFTDRRR